MLAPPVLVLSPPGQEPARLAAMLGLHPALSVLPELSSSLAPKVEGLLELIALTEGSAGQGLLRAVAAVFCGSDSEDGIELARAWLRRRADWNLSQIRDAFAAALAPSIMVSADTEAAWRPDQLDRLLETSPDVRILHLIENPRAWCRGRVAALDGRLFVAPDFKDYGVNPPILDPQIAWLRVHTAIERSCAPLGSTQYRCYRVEDLYAAPESVLSGICEWLGVPVTVDDLVRMQHPELSLFANFGPPSAPHGADESFLQSPWFMRRLPSRLALGGPLEWRKDGRGFAHEVIELGQQYGYA